MTQKTSIVLIAALVVLAAGYHVAGALWFGVERQTLTQADFMRAFQTDEVERIVLESAGRTLEIAKDVNGKFEVRNPAAGVEKYPADHDRINGMIQRFVENRRAEITTSSKAMFGSMKLDDRAIADGEAYRVRFMGEHEQVFADLIVGPMIENLPNACHLRPYEAERVFEAEGLQRSMISNDPSEWILKKLFFNDRKFAVKVQAVFENRIYVLQKNRMHEWTLLQPRPDANQSVYPSDLADFVNDMHEMTLGGLVDKFPDDYSFNADNPAIQLVVWDQHGGVQLYVFGPEKDGAYFGMEYSSKNKFRIDDFQIKELRKKAVELVKAVEQASPKLDDRAPVILPDGGADTAPAGPEPKRPARERIEGDF